MTGPSFSRLEVRGLEVAYGAHPVVHDLDLSVVAGERVALVGPNGSGKSTLLKALVRLVTPRRGEVLLDGRPLPEVPTREVARTLGILPQAPVPPEGITVRELVAQGRYPHRALLTRARAADRDAVAHALEVTGTARFADRYVARLSGGERQRVWIALVIAQQTPVLLLDEPTTYLDLGHQLEVLELVERLADAHDLTVVSVLHDLDHAARFADRVVVLDEGRVVADGAPADVVDERLLAEVFGVRATVLRDPERGHPVCLAHGATPRRTA